MAMQKATFLNYQSLYLDFITERAATGCTQAQYCRDNNVLPMTLSRALKVAQSSNVDFTKPCPGSTPDPDLGPKKKRRIFSPESVEFIEVFL